MLNKEAAMLTACLGLLADAIDPKGILEREMDNCTCSIERLTIVFRTSMVYRAMAEILLRNQGVAATSLFGYQ